MIPRKQIVLVVLLLSACAGGSNKSLSTKLPVANSGDISRYDSILEKAITGHSYDTETASGKAVNFIVEEEYISANNEKCKRFIINKLPQLACNNGRQWFDKRAF